MLAPLTRRHLGLAAAVLLLAWVSLPAFAATWGANYFPNVPLQTQDGDTVHFFDDLIKGKIVAVNFIYTTCVDTCPLETAQLVRVQDIIGDRLGQDIFFYSITIDPEHDTPEALKDYKERFGANWTFLTGKESDIVLVRRKLGLYIEEIQDGSGNHNVSMIIGNQATGRWMKRSPFENPYVLADQLGNWLAGWKAPPAGRGYATAPELRRIPRGEQIFRTRCASCHSMTGEEPAGALGPDLLGVTRRREMKWLVGWLRAPDRMLADKDPIAMALYETYNKLAMPNARLNEVEVMALIEYLDEETERLTGPPRPPRPKPLLAAAVTAGPNEPAGDVVAIMNAWVREADPKAKGNAGYMTLVNVGSEDVALVKVESEAFDAVEVHEMAMVDGLMKMRQVTDVVVPPNGQVRFQPGGRHLMLMGSRERLTAGQAVDLTLIFKSGRKQEVSVQVADR